MENNNPNVIQSETNETLKTESSQRKFNWYKYKRRKSSPFKVVVGIIFCILLSIPISELNLYIFTGEPTSEREKIFFNNGLLFNLTNHFIEVESGDYDMVYTSPDRFFAVTKQGRISSDTLDVYTKFENYLTEFYFSEVTRSGYSFLVVIIEKRNNCYIIQYGCQKEDYPKYQEQFFEWAKKIRIL